MRMSTRWAAAAVATLSFSLACPAMAQPPEDALPNAPGKDITVEVCTSCHGADQFAFARMTPDEWANEVSKMQSAGAEMTGDEVAAITDYLSKYLAKSPPPASDAKSPPAAPDAKTPPQR